MSCLVTRVHVCLDEHVYNTLYTACKTGNLTAVQQILNDLKSAYGGSSQTVDAADAGETPADSDSVEVPTAVSWLLCHNESTTLLHAASQCGHDPSVVMWQLFVCCCIMELTLLSSTVC